MNLIDKKLFDIRKRFDDVCHDVILPNILGFEKHRKTKLFLFVLKSLIVEIIIGIASYYHLFPSRIRDPYAGQPYFDIGVISCFVVFSIVILPIIFYSFDKSFKKDVKAYFIKDLVNSFDKLKYLEGDNQKACITSEDIIKSKIFNQTRIKKQDFIDDSFEGNIDGVKFNIIDARLEFFSGLIFKFNLKNKSNSFIKITPKKYIPTSKEMKNGKKMFIFAFFIPLFLYSLFKLNVIGMVLTLILYALACIISPKVYYNRAAKEGVLTGYNFLDKEYNVFSNNKKVALDYIKPEFIDFLIYLKSKFKKENILCSIFDETLIVAIETDKDYFELGGILRSLNDKKLLNEFFDIFEITYISVEYLKGKYL